jgi:hypothetical protein
MTRFKSAFSNQQQIQSKVCDADWLSKRRIRALNKFCFAVDGCHYSVLAIAFNQKIGWQYPCL